MAAPQRKLSNFAEILAMRRSGKTDREIAALVGVSRSRAGQLCRRALYLEKMGARALLPGLVRRALEKQGLNTVAEIVHAFSTGSIRKEGRITDEKMLLLAAWVAHLDDWNRKTHDEDAELSENHRKT